MFEHFSADLKNKRDIGAFVRTPVISKFHLITPLVKEITKDPIIQFYWIDRVLITVFETWAKNAEKKMKRKRLRNWRGSTSKGNGKATNPQRWEPSWFPARFFISNLPAVFLATSALLSFQLTVSLFPFICSWYGSISAPNSRISKNAPPGAFFSRRGMFCGCRDYWWMLNDVRKLFFRNTISKVLTSHGFRLNIYGDLRRCFELSYVMDFGKMLRAGRKKTIDDGDIKLRWWGPP